MIEEFFLLVRRVQGIGLSIDDYWEMDTWTTAKLVSMERAIMDMEAKQYSDNKREYEERPEGNSEEMTDLVDEMTMD